MTEARPRPWLGALLGLLLGVVTMGLLWLLGVVPPDRLPLFGIVALSVAGAMAATTQRLSAARGSTITIIVFASLLGGVALTGIPESVRGGSLSDGCTFEGTSSQEPEIVSPAQTSGLSPFDVTTTDTVEWTGAIPSDATEAEVDIALLVGGFAIPLYDASMSVSEGASEWGGAIDVASVLDDFKSTYGFDLTGTFHFSAEFDTGSGLCEGEGYVRVLPPSAFGGIMLAALWAVLAVLVVAIIVVAVVVRRSFSAADEDLRTAQSGGVPEDTLGTGGPVSQVPTEDRPVAGSGVATSSAAAAGAASTAPERSETTPEPEPNGARHERTPAGTGVPDEADHPAGASPAVDEAPHEAPDAPASAEDARGVEGSGHPDGGTPSIADTPDADAPDQEGDEHRGGGI